MKHLNEQDLSAMADGALAGERLWRAQQHLEGCAACRDALADLSARDAALDAALDHDPGEAYFATFADRVVGRIADAEKAGEAEGAASAAGDMLRAPIRLPWWQRPRSLALAGTVTAVVAAAGIVLLTAREGELPNAARERSAAGRALQAPSAPSEPSSDAPADDRVAAKVQATERANADAALGADEADRATAANEAPPADADVRAPAASPTLASPPPAAESEASRPSAATRMKEVPRGVSGERRSAAPAPAAGFAAPPRAPDPNATTAEKLRELKRAALGPSGLKSETQAPPAAAAPEAAPAPTAAYDAAARRDLGALRQEAAIPVCGVVRDDSGRPLAGVTVSAVDLARTTTSGADGRFCLELPPGAHELQLLAVGFRPGRLSVGGEASGAELAAVLQPVAVLGSSGAVRGGEAGEGALRAARTPTAAAPAGPATISLGDAAFAPLTDSLRALAAEAARLQSRAAGVAGPAGYESAATAWERLLPGVVHPGPEVEFHARIAECRYAAWQRASDARRSSRAVEALTRYVGRAPAGPRRDLAARWIDQVRSR